MAFDLKDVIITLYSVTGCFCWFWLVVRGSGNSNNIRSGEARGYCYLYNYDLQKEYKIFVVFQKACSC